jgi:S-adenosylmethionine:tRNA ribosyltransferase-isomerase
MPIPPYIKAQPANPEDYQTVYARREGSVAAPTAGLHFTAQLIEEIRTAGVETAYLTLHVGVGTFRPVKTSLVAQHQMHAEEFELQADAAEAINQAKTQGRRVVAVGTTVVRVLESLGAANGRIRPARGETSLFIVPGFSFRVVDALITNFHLPRSTLLMLVSAFVGREKLLAAYAEAIANGYRFFSFGDATLID